jgi:nucleoside-diphosphate-sugar epimerase
MTAGEEVIIVTGSSGLIGFPLCERLEVKHRVVAFDREGPPHPPKSTDVVVVDLTSDENVTAALKHVKEVFGSRIASVVHLAAYYNFTGGNRRLYDEITVKGTERLLNDLDGFEVEQFLFSSTMLVHAPCRPGERITESSPLLGKWDYPDSKIRTEKIIRARRGRAKAVYARIAGVYMDDGHSIPLAHQMQRIYEKKLESRLFPGDLSAGQNFMHLDDLLDALELIVEKRKELPDEFPVLLGEPETIPYGELQDLFGRALHGRDWKTWRVPKWFAKFGAWAQNLLPGKKPFIKPWMIDMADDHYALDVSRAEKALGWRPKRSLRATIPLMAAALKRDPEAWYKANQLA